MAIALKLNSQQAIAFLNLITLQAAIDLLILCFASSYPSTDQRSYSNFNPQQKFHTLLGVENTLKTYFQSQYFEIC